MLYEFIHINGRFGPNDSRQHLLVLLLQLTVGSLSLLGFHWSHVVSWPCNVCTGSHCVIRGCMEHLDQLSIVLLARLFLIRPLTADNRFNLVKKGTVLSFYLGVTILFQLNCFGVWYFPEVVIGECVYGPLSILQVCSVLLVIFVVVYGVEKLARPLLLCLNVFDSLHIGCYI